MTGKEKADDTLLVQNLIMLNRIGQDPFKYGRFSVIRTVFTCAFQTITGTLIVMEAIFHWNSLDSLGGAVETFPAFYQVLSKIIIFASFRLKFVELYEMLSKFWPMNRYGDDFSVAVHKPIRYLTVVLTFYKYVVSTYLVAYFIKPLFSKQHVYPAAWYNLCDINGNLCYYAGYSWQAFNTYQVFIVVVAGDGILYYLLARVYCELKLVVRGLENVTVHGELDGDEEVSLKEVGELVEHHNLILRFIRNLNIIYSPLLLNQFWTNLICICIGIFLLTIDGIPPDVTHFMRYIPYVMTFYMQLLCYCLGGQLIKDQTDRVFHAAYSSAWHVKKQPKFTKSIIIIMLKTTKPEILTVGGLWDLNIQTFTAVLKTSLSFLTAVQTMYR